MAAKIIPFRKPKAQKPMKSEKQRIDELVASWVSSELAQFADALVTARAILKLYPELVKAPKVPEHLCRAFKEEWDDDANDPNLDFGTPGLSRKEMRKLRRTATAWIRGEREAM